MYAHPNSVVSTQWVAEHLNDPGVRMVEVIWGSQTDMGLTVYRPGIFPAQWPGIMKKITGKRRVM